MSEDNNKLIISILGLEKLFTPTMEYAGEQLLELVKYLVDRAKKRLYQEEKSDFFHGAPGRNTPLILEMNGSCYRLPIESARSANPFDSFPKWYWPLHDNNSEVYIDQLLCQVDRNVNRNDFLNALCKSLSLSIKEKQRVIDAWPTLSQFQIDELLKVFAEEQRKFEEELFIDQPRDVWSLVYERQLDWAIIVLKDKRVGLESFLIPPLNGDFLFPYFALWSDFWKKNGAILMDEIKDYRSASRALQQACYLSPDNSYCWLRLGYCYVKLKYWDFGIGCLNKARSFDKDNNIVLLDICELHILKSEFDKADDVLHGIEVNLPEKYQHVYAVLDFILKLFREDKITKPNSDLLEFVNDLENETPWYWGDLKDHITNSSLDNEVKLSTAKFLQRLIALS